MKKLMFFSFLVFGLVSWNLEAQTENLEKKDPNVPKGTWSVHKEYDEQGNLIAMDSTYTYSSFNGKSVSKEEMESLMKDFQSQFPNGFEASDLWSEFEATDWNSLFEEISFDEIFDQFNSVSMEELFSEFDSDQIKQLIEELDFNNIPEVDFNHIFGEGSDDLNKLMEEGWEKLQEYINNSESGGTSIPKVEKNKVPSDQSQPQETEKLYKI